MFDFNLKNKAKGYVPYAVIMYLLCGGSGMPELSDLDLATSGYVMEQADQVAPEGGLKGMYNKLLNNKQPDNRLPGKTSFSGPELPKQPKDSPVSDLVRKLLQFPSNLPGSSNNYGY